MKIQLGLDIGTNSVGWALVKTDFDQKNGEIIGTGSRIIPMSQKISNEFGRGNPVSNTADRTQYRGARRLYQRKNLRRERLLRVLNVLDYLPPHFSTSIDFLNKKGQYKPGQEVKISQKYNQKIDKYEFVFQEAFEEMLACFKDNGYQSNIPSDWTIYYLRVKALTSKVSKEELSWILLNFNQKRGYYQSRDEDLEESTKGKEFHELHVERLEDTGEQIKGKSLFKVIFSNGWVYDKLVVNTGNWEGQTKEFIVTSKDLKDGNIKRSYKEVDSEADWAAIKAKKEDELQKSNKTVGQYIFDRLIESPIQKIRGKYLQTIGREFYKEELQKILSNQAKYYPELSEVGGDLFLQCCKELYSKNIAHRNNIAKRNLIYLLSGDILFYQRPLKSKKSTIGGCQFERRCYREKDSKTEIKKTIIRKVKVASKSHPLFQEYRLWQFIHNLEIYLKEENVNGGTIYDVNVTDRILTSNLKKEKIFELLNSKKEITESQFFNSYIQVTNATF